MFLGATCLRTMSMVLYLLYHPCGKYWNASGDSRTCSSLNSVVNTRHISSRYQIAWYSYNDIPMFLISLEKSVYQYHVNIFQTQVKKETICGTTYPSLWKDEVESPFKLTDSPSFVFIISSCILTNPLFSIHLLTFNWFICRFILYITK